MALLLEHLLPQGRCVYNGLVLGHRLLYVEALYTRSPCIVESVNDLQRISL